MLPTTTTVWENDVPDFVEDKLAQLYGALYSSLAYFRISNGLSGINTYVDCKDGVINAIFLFRRDQQHVTIVNEGMRLRSEDINRFARFVFSGSESVGSISFHAVQIDPGSLSFLHHRSFCAEDFIAVLPDTPDAFLAKLGASTRKNLKRHKNRLERDFPSFQYRFYDRQDASEVHIRQIIEMNRIRMNNKGMQSYIDEEETRQIIRLVHECGTILVATIEGQICGGTILYRVGDNQISKVNAHDPKFDGYRLGMLCCYLSICEAIKRGAKRFHLGHTWYEYKVSLLGEYQQFHHIVLYRSPQHLLRNSRMAIKTTLAGFALQANRWVLYDIQRNEGGFSAALKKALRSLHNRKDLKRRIPGA